MTDVFRSEILAVVMQQILDQPVLPTLFMRTVSSDCSTYYSHAKMLTRIRFQGDTSRQNVQVVDRFRLHDVTLTTDYEKNLDHSTALAGLYPLCPNRGSRKLFSPSTTPEGAITGIGSQAADPARSPTRICPEKRRQPRAGRCIFGDYWRG
jgi:Symplekin tight junction protein C terminal